MSNEGLSGASGGTQEEAARVRGSLSGWARLFSLNCLNAESFFSEGDGK